MAAAKYKVAIIGTGRMGGLIEDEQPYPNAYTKPYSHYMAYTVTPETEVVAVANRGAPRLERYLKRFPVENSYFDYREMILKEKPDIVSVTTPSFARAEPIIFAAENDVKGIYAEKGLCSSLEEADRVTAAVKANNVAFNWGASRRHHSAYVQIAEAIADGDIGEPKFVVCYQFTDLIKHHPHTLDTASMLIGDPRATWVEGRLIEPGSERDNSVGVWGRAIRRPMYEPESCHHLYTTRTGTVSSRRKDRRSPTRWSTSSASATRMESKACSFRRAAAGALRYAVRRDTPTSGSIRACTVSARVGAKKRPSRNERSLR